MWIPFQSAAGSVAVHCAEVKLNMLPSPRVACVYVAAQEVPGYSSVSAATHLLVPVAGIDIKTPPTGRS